MTRIVYSTEQKAVVMTSLEVSDYLKNVNLKKDHKNILRDIEVQLQALDESRGSNLSREISSDEAQAVKSTYTDDRGKDQPIYIMNEEFAMILISGYDVLTRQALVRKIKSLQTQLQGLAHTNSEKQIALKQILYASGIKSDEIRQQYAQERGKAGQKVDDYLGISNSKTLKAYSATLKRKKLAIAKEEAEMLAHLEKITRDAILALGVFQHEAINTFQDFTKSTIDLKTLPVNELVNDAKFLRAEYFDVPIGEMTDDSLIVGKVLRIE